MTQEKTICNLYGILPDNRKVWSYRLTAETGASVEILSLGGIIRSLFMPDKNGNFADIVMGHQTLKDQISNWYWTGGIIGRCANRIANAEMTIKGKRYQLEKNAGPDHIHGGSGCYMMKLFEPEFSADSEGEKLTLYYKDHGEAGFPGNVDVWVTYLMTPANEVKISYKALPSEDTVLNLTNHCYFNLNGHDSGSILDHELQINADYYLPNDKRNIPTGEIRRVTGTTFDFIRPRRIRTGLENGDCQIVDINGYDHNFCLKGRGFREVAQVYAKKSGRYMKILTDMPGMQLYTSNDSPADLQGKDGIVYHPHDALCLETQFYPNAVVFTHFVSPIFSANQLYQSETVYAFSVR